MALTWSNWAGNETCTPEAVHVARSVDDVRGLVAAATTRGATVRVAGSGHSHHRLVPTDGVVLDLSAFTGVIDADAAAGTATVWAGSVIASLGRPLAERGVALANQGDIDRQSIGGAVATGTHGTGRTLRNLSAAVLAMDVVTADGSLERWSATEHGDRFAAARLHLGAFGVVVALTLAVRPAYRLADRVVLQDYESLRPTIEASVGAHRHFEFFWYPGRDRAMVKSIDETEAAPAYPIGPEGERTGWSYEVLPSNRVERHTEIEYALPLESSLACLDEIRDLVRRDFPELRWPVEYRTLAADDVWLSPAYGRDVATISLHQGIGLPDEPVFRAAEAVFARYDGRPHWGKVHYRSGEDLAAIHPRWDDWWAVRNGVDPTGTFLNDRLASWR
jgi:FAD/FMN-containing dehydrogenase